MSLINEDLKYINNLVFSATDDEEGGFFVFYFYQIWIGACDISVDTGALPLLFLLLNSSKLDELLL